MLVSFPIMLIREGKAEKQEEYAAVAWIFRALLLPVLPRKMKTEVEFPLQIWPKVHPADPVTAERDRYQSQLHQKSALRCARVPIASRMMITVATASKTGIDCQRPLIRPLLFTVRSAFTGGVD
eukprot:TRINITY_DN27698_c0_g1_i1.p1 TRINITY_DN27698_c0_g1~~TRINITY_DN27698_c0_g1_i1.p1  ORF type:complete len:124 (+),score=4.24 TRINITY_DN27698_c0_g1_i1:292-663(+)